jgi:hypothetical protein
METGTGAGEGGRGSSAKAGPASAANKPASGRNEAVVIKRDLKGVVRFFDKIMRRGHKIGSIGFFLKTIARVAVSPAPCYAPPCLKVCRPIMPPM